LAASGINVLLHEYAHAQYHISIEAMAQCFAGQWLADFEQHFYFTASIREADWSAFWDDYSQRISSGDGYGDFSCATGWDAPDFFTGHAVSRRIRPITNAYSPSLSLHATWVSASDFGATASTFAAGTTKLDATVTSAPDWYSPHLLQFEWVANGSVFSTGTFTYQPGWTRFSESIDENDGSPLPAGDWMVRVWVDHSLEISIDFTIG
jgi:hypothetical protein